MGTECEKYSNSHEFEIQKSLFLAFYFSLRLKIKMKQKISITIEEDKIRIIEKLLEEGKYRSKSHILEYGLNNLLKEELKNE
ncbi:MAG: hypothetical protein ABH840_03330 [Nanoarchaeota archaeon]